MSKISLAKVGSWRNLRVLAWDADVLYASSGYKLLRARATEPEINWSVVGRFRPDWWRNFSSALKLPHRLFRDGFHALAPLSSGGFVAAVPGAIVTLAAGADEFEITHKITRGTRPLNITVTPEDWIYWGEYFDNSERAEVHVYGSQNNGRTWDVVYTFPNGAVRHIHNVLYDKWANCLWVLTGDYEEECRVIRASCDWKDVQPVLCGNQQARAVAMVPTKQALYFASDTPLEDNFIYQMDRSGVLARLDHINNSALYGCRTANSLFFSTMVEPSEVNTDGQARVYGSIDGSSWQMLLAWPKDRWPMALFQYGNAILPTGENHTDLLAVTGLAVKGHDLQTTIWKVHADAAG